MPERVTKEERQISLLIEKARSAKEVLTLSLENNRSPIDDDSEHVKLKRPKAENDKTKFVSNDGPVSNSSYAGEMFKKAINILKAINESDYDDNPLLNDEARTKHDQVITSAHEQMSKILADAKAGRTDLGGQIGALLSLLETLQKDMKESGKGGNPLIPTSSQKDYGRSNNPVETTFNP
tara:strand:- start:123 stop:662 length:540 start_codon:yes stop_codon:yes gene_type:complete